ncbi:MAG: tetratricopeptide repeat protein [Rubrivivax sp.]
MAAPRLADALRAQRDGREGDARRLCQALLTQDPAQFDAWLLLAMLSSHAGDHEGALQALQRAEALRPGDAALQANRGNVLDAAGRPEAALAAYDAALRQAPGFAAAHLNRAQLLQRLGRWAEAAAAFEGAAHEPAFADVLADAGRAWLLAGRPESALVDFDHVLARRGPTPDAISNRAAALRDLGRATEALAAADAALSLQPQQVPALVNRGTALQDLGRLDEAVAAFEQAAALQTDGAEARWNLALALLQRGDLTRGFELYETRFERGDLGVPRRHRQLQAWDGRAPLGGRRVLVHAEQGLGDTLQFARFVLLLAAQGAQVVLEVQRPLQRLLTSLDGVARCIAMGADAGPVDAAVPLMSLPHRLGITLDRLPGATGYLRADPALVRAWRQRLGPTTRPRIGLQWRGGQVSRIRGRQLPLQQLAPVLNDRFDWVSLQKDLPDDDRSALAALPQLRHFGAEQQDMADAAALCSVVDAVVSVDTSIAHLAGALARPTWVLLPAAADWRWLVQRVDSPWYASLRLLRQTRDGDWSGPLAMLATALETSFGR